MRLCLLTGVLVASAVMSAAELPQKIAGFSLRSEVDVSVAIVAPSSPPTIIVGSTHSTLRGIPLSQWPQVESEIVAKIGSVRDTGQLVKRNVFPHPLLINGHADNVDKFDKAYLLYTAWCIDETCKTFRVTDFSIYFEHPVGGLVKSKYGPDKECPQEQVDSNSICLKPSEFRVDLKGVESYLVSEETYRRLQVNQHADFAGFGPLRWTPVL